MALVVPNVSEVQMLIRLVGDITSLPSRNQVMKLYTSPLGNIDDDFSAASFAEATAAGYAPATMVPAGWSAATVSGTSSATYSPDVTFSFTAAESVAGYYVVDTTSPTAVLLWAESFSGGPFVLPSSGGQIQITPTLSLA